MSSLPDTDVSPPDAVLTQVAILDDVAAAPCAPSKDELYQMVNDPKYKTDVAYRQKVEMMFAQRNL